MKDEDHDETIVVDAYGFRLRAQRGDLGETTPTSWTEVGEQIRGHLLRLATAPTRLIVEALEGTTKLIRGLSSVPSALATRIASSHEAADLREHGRERVPAPSPDVALAQLDRVLQRLIVKGYCAEIVVRNDGTPVIIIVAPGEREAAEQLATSTALAEVPDNH
jgi:hypothetical protein